jgi:hypothetical protein
MRESDWFSWPSIIASRAALPPIFHDAVPDDKPFPYAVHLQSQPWAGQSKNPKLVCLYPDRIVILERTNAGAIAGAAYPFEAIHRIVHGRNLLHSWLELHGVVAGKPAISTVVYNTVVDYMFDPIIVGARNFPVGPGSPANDPSLARREFDFLRQVNFKLHNYAPMEVLPGASIKQILYQPELRARVLVVFQRTAIPNRVVILTDKELISVSDAVRAESRAPARRTGGVVKSFVPLRGVRDAAIAPSDRPGVMQLAIALANGEEPRLLFESRLAGEWETLRDALRQAAGAAAR